MCVYTSGGMSHLCTWFIYIYNNYYVSIENLLPTIVYLLLVYLAFVCTGTDQSLCNTLRCMVKELASSVWPCPGQLSMWVWALVLALAQC